MSEELLVDWANAPAGIESTSLWCSVHDADLYQIKSDLLTRTVTIEFAVPYLLSFHKLPEDLRFMFSLCGVQSVRALEFAVWPGEIDLPASLTWEERQRRTTQYQRKGRQQSESWVNVERAITNSEDVEITDGDLLKGTSGAVALRLGVLTGDGNWYEVLIRSEEFSIQRGDGREETLDHFLEMGRAYWDAFASRKPGTTTSGWPIVNQP